MSADLKMKKSQSVRDSLRAFGSFASAQGMVWEEIDAKFARMQANSSPTMALSDLYERHQDLTDDFLKAFHPVDKQIGMVLFIDGEVAGVELLGRFEPFKKNHAKLVHSYVMDALEIVMFTEKPTARVSKAKVGNILESAAKAAVEKRQSVALGEDVRVESETVVGAGLEFEGNVVQLTLFAQLNGSNPSARKTSIIRASRRRDLIGR